MMNVINEVRLVSTETLSKLKIDSTEFLDDVEEREICEYCAKSRKYFCYSCYQPMTAIKDKIPRVQLPYYVDIIKFPKEVDGKSTAAHAPILAPDFITVHMFPNIPDYVYKSKVLIVFPGEQSITLQDMANDFDKEFIQKENCMENGSQCNAHCKKAKADVTHADVCSLNKSETNKECAAIETLTSRIPMANEKLDDGLNWNCETCANHKQFSNHNKSTIPEFQILSRSESDVRKFAEDDCSRTCKRSNHFPFERVIFIDSTWNQVQKINNDERLAGIPRVELKGRDSLFWRFQRGKPRTYLSTIEAIYYFLVDSHELFGRRPYRGEYDNLLFFFYFMYKKIHLLYDPQKLRVNCMQ